MSGVGSSPALATCETSQVLLAGVSGGFPGVLPFRPTYRLARLYECNNLERDIKLNQKKKKKKKKFYIKSYVIVILPRKLQGRFYSNIENYSQIIIKYTTYMVFKNSIVNCPHTSTCEAVSLKVDLFYLWSFRLL